MTSPDQRVPEKPPFEGVVREFTMQDLPYLRRILEMWVRDSETHEIIPEEVEKDLQHLRDSLLPGSSERYFVAEDPSGRVVGMMGLVLEPKDALKPFAKTEKPMELVRAYVDKDFRGGRGVGTSLIRRIEQETKRRGGTEVILDSGPRYEKTGHGFYLKMGYEIVGVNKDYYGSGGDATVFSKVLT